MQDAADEITLRDEEGTLRPEFLHAVEAALDSGDADAVRELTLDLHEADLADLIQLLRPDQRELLIATLGHDFNAAASVISTDAPVAFTPIACSSATAPATWSALRAHTATPAPSPASVSAIARPMPRVPPSTTAFLPFKPKSILFSFVDSAAL